MDGQPRVRKELSFMGIRQTVYRHTVAVVFAALVLAAIAFVATFHMQARPAAEAAKISSEALRLNTLGVAHMNQGKSAEAEGLFQQALAVDPKFSGARLNLGVALLAQQKLESARAALEQAAKELPDDPYTWYNLGLAYKDSAEPEKALEAFRHVEKIVPEEP